MAWFEFIVEIKDLFMMENYAKIKGANKIYS